MDQFLALNLCGLNEWYHFLDKMISKWPSASWKLDSKFSPYEAGFLKLDISKAKARLGWQPVWELSYTLENIIKWHQAWLEKADMQVMCFAEIDDYTGDMNK